MHLNYEKSHPYFNDFILKLAAQELVRMALELCYVVSACQCHALIGCNTGGNVWMIEFCFILRYFNLCWEYLRVEVIPVL